MRVLMLLCIGLVSATAGAESRMLDDRMHHLRIDGPPEWSAFPETADSDRMRILFAVEADSLPQTLRLRQQDVRQDWVVRLNGMELGRLVRDENDQIVYFPIPAGSIAAGESRLIIEQLGGGPGAADDIRVGEISLDSRPLSELLSEAAVDVTVIDADSGEALPSRITILNDSQSLQSVQVPPSSTIAVRAGTVYTADGQAKCGMPAGRYTVYAGRGFEYSLAAEEIELQPGEHLQVTLAITREVPTEGYVACDTHIHSRTHSGHGDATVAERMVTIAGEGIELAVATDHNVSIDHRTVAQEVGVRQYFTPVAGNEVTTPVGHFNIFPVDPQSAPPNPRLRSWPEVFDEIERAAAAPVVILNHGRDLHSGFRPLGPQRFNAVVAASVDGWPMGFNGMEVINSGATQTDTMRLFHDWMALLNRGVAVAPVGSSDSHDVLRHFVGQGRTYIRCNDHDPSDIDVAHAVRSFRKGQVMVSYGLLAEIDVNGCASGEVAAVSSDLLTVDLRVLGPHWVTGDRVELYMNGSKVFEQKIADDGEMRAKGVKWEGQFRRPAPKHDVHLVAIARGPGIDHPYWRTAKPYQPTSPQWQPETIGCSGAVWIDADGDGKVSSARDYAEQLYRECEGDLSRLILRLEEFDESVAAHVAELYQLAGNSLADDDRQAKLREAPTAVRAAFSRYLKAWRDTQLRDATTP